jgi:hypothetical protein
MKPFRQEGLMATYQDLPMAGVMLCHAVEVGEPLPM